MRILLIEDSTRLQRAISTGLRKSGFKVDLTGDGQEGLWLAESFDYDVIILDLMLPGMDGISILRHLREKQKPVFVLILSAKDTVEDRILGLQKGADDYMVKPFAFEELLARIQSLIRRRYGIQKNVIDMGSIKIDTAKRIVLQGTEEIELSPREYALIEYLAMRKGSVVRRDEIEEHIYDERIELASNVVDATVCSLRKKLQQSGIQGIIKTRRGMGYMVE